MLPALFPLPGLAASTQDEWLLLAGGQPVEDALDAAEVLDIAAVALGTGAQLVDGLGAAQEQDREDGELARGQRPALIGGVAVLRGARRRGAHHRHPTR